MKVKLISLALACALAGCGTAPAPVVQQVEVPVPLPCVKAADLPARPAYEVDQLPADATDGEKVLALARDWPVGRKYESQLEAVIAGCR